MLFIFFILQYNHRSPSHPFSFPLHPPPSSSPTHSSHGESLLFPSVQTLHIALIEGQVYVSRSIYLLVKKSDMLLCCLTPYMFSPKVSPLHYLCTKWCSYPYTSKIRFLGKILEIFCRINLQ